MRYTREQLWKIYEKLPKKLQEAIWSEETAENIASVCEKNGIPEDKIPEIAKCAGYVLLGILPLEEFQKTLEKNIKLESAIAEKVSFEINRFIFSPVKETLMALSKGEIAPERTKPTEKGKLEEVIPLEEPEIPPVPETSEAPEAPETPEAPTPTEEKPTPQPREDTYREPLE